MTPTSTTQIQSMPPMSTPIETATSVIWKETKQIATKPSTSIEIDSTADVITTVTTHKTSVPSVSTDIDCTISITPPTTTLTGTGVKTTVSEILDHYTGLIIAGGIIISGLLFVIASYCLIKNRQKDPSKYTSTNVTNKGEETVSHIYSEPSEVHHEYSEPSEVYHEYSEPSEVYHEYSEPSRVYDIYISRQHGYEETIFQE
ncbi:location of vulva defective 1-like [Mytilus trossulus]|uniref:location of vulva defective 1-like n=1 Tax=Mytilus trossulus TaxID=6551 RepID=UPI00300779BD